MCDFCEKTKAMIDTRGNEKRDTYLYVKNFLGKWYIDYTGIGAQKNMAEIFFCPLCGRKLCKETEKQGIKDKILDEIRKTQPNFLDFSEFYNQYGWLIPGIGDIWHWYEKLTDDAKKEGFAQITDMSAEELFEFYVKVRDDWEAWYKIRLDEKEGTEN